MLPVFPARYPIQHAYAAARLGGDGPPGAHPVPDPDGWMRRLGELPLIRQPGRDGGLGTGWRSGPERDVTTVLLTQVLWSGPAGPALQHEFRTAAHCGTRPPRHVPGPDHPDPATEETTVDWTLEVVVLPVTDLDRSIAFYRDQVGFDLDHDTRNEHMHVAQLTPRGSGCSIVIGDLPAQSEMAPGSVRGLQLVVADAAAARAELVSRGVDAGEITSFGDQDGATFFGFADPDGNTWAVQQLAVRAERPLIPVEARGRFGG